MDLAVILLLCLNLRSDKGRFIFYFAGALTCLGPADITVAKIAYLIILTVITTLQFRKIREDGQLSDYFAKTSKIINCLFIFLVYEFSISFLLDISLISILRSYLPYILFLFSLPIMYKCKDSFSESFITVSVLTFANLSAFSVWFLWSQRHGLHIFPIERIGLDAEWIAFFGFIYALRFQTDTKSLSVLNLVSLIGIPTFLILSLSRTNLIFIFAIIISHFLLFRRNFLVTSFYMSVFLVSSIVISRFLPGDVVSKTVDRFSSTFQLFQIGGLSEQGLGMDLSIYLRRQQTQFAKDHFIENWLIGSGTLPEGQSFDTIWGSLMQYGTIGSILFLVLISAICWQLVSNDSIFRKHFLIYFFLLVPASVIYNWPSNKSFWLANSLLFALSHSKFNKSSELSDE